IRRGDEQLAADRRDRRASTGELERARRIDRDAVERVEHVDVRRGGIGGGDLVRDHVARPDRGGGPAGHPGRRRRRGARGGRRGRGAGKGGRGGGDKTMCLFEHSFQLTSRIIENCYQFNDVVISRWL